MKKTLGAVLLLAGVAIAGRTVMAHHAFGAEFDPSAPIRLQGKVVRLEWVNPHTWIHIETIKDGKPEIWMVEGGTPNTLLRRGITKDTVAIGTEIVVDGYQTKDHSLKRANGRKVIPANTTAPTSILPPAISCAIPTRSSAKCCTAIPSTR